MFGKKSDKSVAVTDEEAGVAGDPQCPHTALMPRWDSLADMGNNEKISGYHCEGCETDFSREQGDRLRETEIGRLMFTEPDRLPEDLEEHRQESKIEAGSQTYL